MSSCSCGWQAVKKSLEAGSHFKENCFILLLPKGQLSRLRDWELRCTLRMGQTKKMWRGYSSFKPFGKETQSTLAPERWVLGRLGTGSKAEVGTEVGSTTTRPEGGPEVVGDGP